MHAWLQSCDVLKDRANLTVFPQPPSEVCGRAACRAETRGLNACSCNLRKGLDLLSLGNLKTVRKNFHPDRFSGCPEAVREGFKAMATEIFVVADAIIKRRG
jgi:hypothetical protein